MYTFSTVLERLPKVSQARFISSACGLWLVWQGSSNNAVFHTLHDHGLVQLVEGHGQSFWLSFDDEVFRAMAKLHIWSKLNPLPLFCQVLPVTALIGYDLTLTASVSREFAMQQTSVAGDLEVLVHPKFQSQVENIRGLTLGRVSSLQGLASPGWMPLGANQGVNYDSPAKWFGVIKPLGRLGESKTIAGWRAFFAGIQELFQRLGVQYITDDAKGFVVFSLESYRQLRLCCTELSSLVAEQKATRQVYWPCVFAVMEQRGLSLSPSVPNRFNLDWNRLPPDFLHMRYRLGFSLLDIFKVNAVSYSGEEETLNSWCYVTPRQGGEQTGQGTIEMPLPRSWLSGSERECFYCGLKNHKPAQCPARLLPPFRSAVWTRLGHVDIADMTECFKKLDAPAGKEDFLGQAKKLLAGGKGENTVDSLLFSAMFALNEMCQPGLLPLLRRIRSKEWPADPAQLAPEEPWPLADAFAAFGEGGPEKAREKLHAVQDKQGATFDAACLEGFLALEAGDARMANFYWQEAGRLGQGALQQGYAQFLQARLQEVQGEFGEALTLYREARGGSPKWLEPAYREGVCMVKMGFTGQAVEIFGELVRKTPFVFNRILVDTEIGRGRVHVLSGLWEPWCEAQAGARDLGKKVEALLKEIPQWFDEDHDFRKPAMSHLERMHALADTNNFVAFRELVRGMEGFSDEMHKRIDSDVKRIKGRVQVYADRLRDVQYEAGWFPFPKLLHDFNRDFNYCVRRINWIMTQHLNTPAKFRTARRQLPEVEKRLGELSKRLGSLRIVRDSTLFAMLMGKNFIWMEVVGLVLALLTVPVLLYYSSRVADNWLVEGILQQKWAFQKGLIFLVTVASLGFGALRSVMIFEKRRNALFDAGATRRGIAKPAGRLAERPRAARAAKTSGAGQKPSAESAAKPLSKPAASPPAGGGEKSAQR